MLEGFDLADPTSINDESHALISSRRVEGTPVFGAAGARLGSIHAVMIHKVSGQVAYAVLSFGGIFGIGSKVYPVPWEKLCYDSELGGYRVDFTSNMINSAPALRLDEADRPTDRAYEERLYDYYGAPHYWSF